MKRVILLSLLLVVAFAAEELELAIECQESLCLLPNCRCASTAIPGGLRVRDTPQFVTLTFDDAVNVVNIDTYRRILNSRTNSNGCPIGTTFYVNHEYTNYQLVNELYNSGFEIGLHSISHRTPQTYWAEASYEDMVREIADQRTQIAHFANIPAEDIKGVRMPFLQLAGNNSFHMMKNYGLLYDSSWPTISHTNPPLWPYTLDYASIQDCPIPPCPTASIPGVWIQPMVAWTDLMDLPCSMADACFAPPDLTDEIAWYNFILTNFERHYKNNRAPFGIYIHEGYLTTHPAVQTALVRFLDLISNLEDAFLVNASDVIEWVKNPVTIPEYKSQLCHSHTHTYCPVNTCPLQSAHNNMYYWLTICNVCPREYPWVGNPLGQ